MVTLTAIGLVVAYSQKMFAKMDPHSKGRFAFVGHSIGLLSSATILVFGLVMLQSSLVSG